MNATMEPIHSSAADSFAYWGERSGWLVALSQHRDSDALERSNWNVITKDVLSMPVDPRSHLSCECGSPEDCAFADPDNDLDDGLGDAAIESCSHFLVGWVEYLLVRPGSSAARRAQEWRDRLADYPVADEEAYSMLEFEEEWCQRCDSAMRQEHPTGRCAKFRGEAEIENTMYAWRQRQAARN